MYPYGGLYNPFWKIKINRCPHMANQRSDNGDNSQHNSWSFLSQDLTGFGNYNNMLFGQFNQFGRPPAEGTPVPMPTAAQQFQPLPAQPPVNFPMGQYGHNPMYGYGFPQQHPSAYGYMSQPFGFGRPMRPPGFHAVTKPAVECSPLTTEELLSLFEDTIMQALEGSNDLVQPAMAAEIMQALPVDPNFILTNEKAISTRHLLETLASQVIQAQLKEFVQGGGSIPQMPEKFADVSKLWEAVRTTFASELDHLRVEQGNAENHGVKQLLSMVCRTLHAAISISPFGGGKAARKRTQLPEVKAVAKRKVEGGTVEIPRSTTAEKTLQDAVVPNEEPKAAKKKRAPKAKAKMSPRKSTSPDDSDVPRVRTRSRGSPGEEGQKAAGRKPLTTQEAAHYGALQPLIVPNCLPRSWAAAGVDECSLSTLCEVFDFLALARPLLYDSKLTVASALQSLETDIFESGGFIVPEGAYLSSELECMVMTKHGEHVVVDVADAKASSCGLMTFRQFVEILLGLGPGENRFDTSGIHKIHCSLMRLLILDRQGNSRKPKDESPTSAKDSARRKKSTKEEKLEVKSEADDLEESEKEDGPVDNNAYQLVFQRLPLTPMTWTHYVCEHLMAVCEELQELINSPHKLRRGPMTWEALEVADNISEYRQLAAEVAVDEYERIPFHRRVAILQFLVRQVCKTQLFRSYVEGGIERTWQVEKNLQGERRKAAKSLPRKLKLAQKTMCEAFDSLSPEEKKSVLPAEMHAYKKHQTCQVVLEAKLDDVKHASVVEKRAVYQETAEEKRAYELKVTHSERLLRNLILFACPRKLPAGYDRHGNLYWIVRSVNLTLQVDKAFVGPLRLAWRNNGNVECQFAPDYPSESWSAPPDVQTRLQALKLHPSFPFFTEFLRELPAGTSGSAFLESYLRASLSPVDLYVPDETPATLPLVPVLDSPKEEVAVDVSPAIEAEAPAAWEGYDDDHLLTFDVDRPSLLPAPPAKCLSLHSLLEPARLPGEWGRTFLSHSAARMYPTSPMVPVPPVWEALRALLASPDLVGSFSRLIDTDAESSTLDAAPEADEWPQNIAFVDRPHISTLLGRLSKVVPVESRLKKAVEASLSEEQEEKARRRLQLEMREPTSSVLEPPVDGVPEGLFSLDSPFHNSFSVQTCISKSWTFARTGWGYGMLMLNLERYLPTPDASLLMDLLQRVVFGTPPQFVSPSFDRMRWDMLLLALLSPKKSEFESMWVSIFPKWLACLLATSTLRTYMSVAEHDIPADDTAPQRMELEHIGLNAPNEHHVTPAFYRENRSERLKRTSVVFRVAKKASTDITDPQVAPDPIGLRYLGLDTLDMPPIWSAPPKAEEPLKSVKALRNAQLRSHPGLVELLMTLLVYVDTNHATDALQLTLSEHLPEENTKALEALGAVLGEPVDHVSASTSRVLTDVSTRAEFTERVGALYDDCTDILQNEDGTEKRKRGRRKAVVGAVKVFRGVPADGGVRQWFIVPGAEEFDTIIAAGQLAVYVYQVDNAVVFGAK